MINILKDKYIELIKKELVRKRLVEDFKVDSISNTVSIKTHLDKRRAKLIATRAMMALGTNKYGNVKVEVIKSELQQFEK